MALFIGDIVGCRPLCPAAIHVSKIILTDSGRKCKGYSKKVHKSKALPPDVQIGKERFFITSRRLVTFFIHIAFLSVSADFLILSNDKLWFWFFLNLAADFLVEFEKSTYPGKISVLIFNTADRQVEIWGQAILLLKVENWRVFCGILKTSWNYGDSVSCLPWFSAPLS